MRDSHAHSAVLVWEEGAGGFRNIEISSTPTAMDRLQLTHPRVAVLVPCYNEEVAIGAVVRDFRAALPDATVYVYDNNSRRPHHARWRATPAPVVRSERCRARGM